VSDPEHPSGLKGVKVRPPERVAARTREHGFTQSGWRLEIVCEEGAGAIVLIESGDTAHYRGDGHFLGWPQDRLEAVYRACLPATDDLLETPQLG
jgi:hypothetical protein